MYYVQNSYQNMHSIFYKSTCTNSNSKFKRQYPTIEELSHELLHFGDSSGAADQNDFRDVLLIHLPVLQHILDRFNGRAEKVHVELLELRARQHLTEIITLRSTFVKEK